MNDAMKGEIRGAELVLEEACLKLEKIASNPVTIRGMDSREFNLLISVSSDHKGQHLSEVLMEYTDKIREATVAHQKALAYYESTMRGYPDYKTPFKRGELRKVFK